MSKIKERTVDIMDKTTNKILTKSCPLSNLSETVEIYTTLGYDVSLNETASGGATSASSIAVNFGGSDTKPFETIKEFMKRFNSRVVNKYKPNYTIKINEDFDLNSVFSRLASLEKSGSKKKTEGTTFGIEDDNGNIMKVTVRSDQAKDFEVEVANYIADIIGNMDGLPLPVKAKELSMAELLFNLKDKFDIIDVDFPQIPKDVIYNADKATSNKNIETDANTEFNNEDNVDDFNSNDSDDNVDDLNSPLDLTDYREKDGVSKLDQKSSDEDDTDVATEFEDTLPDSNSESSILDKVIDMLKAQAEADIEKAKADAENARAEQAKYTAQATQFAIKDKEDQLRYDLEIEEEKKKEKEAKRLADMAKRRLSQTLSVTEADEGSSPEEVMRQKQQIEAKYRILPSDDEKTKAYKAAQQRQAMIAWQARYRQAQLRKQYNDSKEQDAINAAKEKAQQRQQSQSTQNTGEDNPDDF